MQQASDSMILLYADKSCLIYQHKNVKEIEIRLNKDFENLCNCFIGNNLSVHLGENKTKQRPLYFVLKINLDLVKH